MSGGEGIFGNIIVFLTRLEGSDLGALDDMKRDFSKSKNANHSRLIYLLRAKFGSTRVSQIFEKGGAMLKTVSLNGAGKPKEAMSLPKFSFIDVASIPFEKSALRKDLSKTYVLAFFEESILKKVKCHRFSEDELFGPIKRVYDDTARLLNEGRVIKDVNFSSFRRVNTNFVGESAHLIIHVRPHARDACDVERLPTPDLTTGYVQLAKQSFWINREYIASIYKSERRD